MSVACSSVVPSPSAATCSAFARCSWWRGTTTIGTRAAATPARCPCRPGRRTRPRAAACGSHRYTSTLPGSGPIVSGASRPPTVITIRHRIPPNAAAHRRNNSGVPFTVVPSEISATGAPSGVGGVGRVRAEPRCGNCCSVRISRCRRRRGRSRRCSRSRWRCSGWSSRGEWRRSTSRSGRSSPRAAGRPRRRRRQPAPPTAAAPTRSVVPPSVRSSVAAGLRRGECSLAVTRSTASAGTCRGRSRAGGGRDRTGPRMDAPSASGFGVGPILWLVKAS